MPADDRKRKILDHLNLSSGGIKYTSSKSPRTPFPATPSFEPEVPVAPPPSPSLPKVENRKRRILDHLNQSSNDFKRLVNDSEQQKKQKIQDHLKKSLE